MPQEARQAPSLDLQRQAALDAARLAVFRREYVHSLLRQGWATAAARLLGREPPAVRIGGIRRR
jgi:hypothetical protein